MSSKDTPCASASRLDPSKDSQIVEASQSRKDIVSIIDSLKKQVAAERCVFIKKRMEENKEKLMGITNHVYALSKERRCNGINGTNKNLGLLVKRQGDTLGMLNGLDLNNGEKDTNGAQEDNHASSAVLIGTSFGVKNNIVRPIKLPEVKKLPPYTTWIFLDRNQRMTEDQSVVGRRRIYYDQNGGEALICSDSEEEIVEEEEDKREFGNCEDYILRKAIQEVGSSDDVLDLLAQCFSRRPCEVKARYELLTKEEKDALFIKKGNIEDNTQMDDSFFDKDLDAALDSFDNLFCRRCLVFDCRLHGCSQDLVFPADKQLPWNHPDEEKVPCGMHCYRLAQKSESIATMSSPVHDGLEEKPVPSSCSAGNQISPRKKGANPSAGRKTKSNQSESASSNARNASESSESEIRPRQDSASIHHSSSPPKAKLVGKCGVRKRNSKRVAERVVVCMRKRQKKMVTSDSDSVVSGCIWPRDMKLRSNSRKENEEAISSQRKVKTPPIRKSRRKESPIQESKKSALAEVHDEPSDEMAKGPLVATSDETSRKEEFVDDNVCKHEATGDKSWKAIEKGLFAKGLEIFGRNSCLISRNLLNGMRTCAEVFQYMNCTENKLSYRGSELRTRSRFVRRRGRVRRLKYTWKSAGYHSIRKRITERKDQPCRQYNPCGCQSACGKQCACLLNGTCCEKYCGCPKSCKNRFRGCHCAKSQCRSRQCPCFAADRECDPDVCRNCWVGCGDGTLGVPSQRGDNYECRNMKLLLKQQQRVLLGRSDVSGWGAFLKNSVGKHEYLGEYTGELISHREADKRGKIYDRENSSFLFNLNDQFVLDAYRKGDKLKFANHSPDPNCYAKVIMVAGDHRVGIFAKERINAGEELFYDYRYEPDRAPAWAKKPEATGSKKEEVSSSGRAKKLA
ncbi:PREDICTED: histone-lysine N-methyltransferase EZ1-like isoform X2 [Nelumbo nucifera]|uniref:Histone-lysine N-methyltransferase EZ1-like isoform X2 n=1 Tax=Nelumbo nucifera TaxID=4432 RepID=A0A1U8ARL3_NELNU|nr:PREDICTED: histone-lysine N-methyltransferase EZ1-like isoform X2 [Nelumbo nucifera]